MTAPTITGHCATCSGPVVSDPAAVLCRACWARENAALIEDGAFEAAMDDLIAAAHTDGACGGGRSQGTDDAIDALLALHSTAVAAAEAAGYARAMRGVDAACDELADLDEFEAIAVWRIGTDRWRAEATASAESTAVGVGLTATGAIIDLVDCANAVAP